MKRFTVLFVLAFAGTAAANSYLDNKKTVTHDCAKDPEAAVEGNANTITFTGTCERISADGNENKLKIESVKVLDVRGNKNTAVVGAVDAVRATGNDNSVTWTKGISGKAPKVASPGSRNKIGSAK
jgi:hypothetical protein